MAEKNLGTLAALQEVHGKHQERVLGLQNVVGVGIGNKMKQGVDTGELALSVFVSQKLPGDLIRSADMVPGAIEGGKRDVVETGPIFAGAGALGGPAVAEPQRDVTAEVLTQRVRPALGGFSVGHYQITAGTYATAGYDSTPFPGIRHRYYILSNNHVLANSNNAQLGDPILQPGPYDGGTVATDTIARLSRFVPIQFSTPTSTPLNFVDAALAQGNFEQVSREIYWIGYVRGAVAPAIGVTVQKTGRTTNYTTGRITTVNATVDVNYGGGKVARFVQQIVTTNMSAPGDSGSLILDLSGQAVGLLFAGSSTVTICNDIRYVQSMLGIRIV